MTPSNPIRDLSSLTLTNAQGTTFKTIKKPDWRFDKERGQARSFVLDARSFEVTARVTNLGIDHSWNIAQDVLHAPEAAAGDYRHLHLLCSRFVALLRALWQMMRSSGVRSPARYQIESCASSFQGMVSSTDVTMDEL